MEKWSKINLKKLKKNKCKVLQVGQNSSMNKYRLESYYVGSTTAEKDLRGLVDHKLNMS